MRPILYDENEKSFASMGIGVLADCTSCKATEERNGEYEVELTYPIAGTLYSEIAISRQVLVRPSDGAELQPFRIYKISRPIRGIVTICAQHVRYQMSHIPLLPFSAGSAAECISKIANYAAEECPFEFSTDVAVTATYNQTVPASMLSRLGGVTGSLIDCYGGEWEFDRYKAILHAARGQDRGVVIRYGINLTDLKQEESIADTYTGICPYWKGSDDTVVTLPERVVESEAADKYPYKRTKVVDFSTEWTEKPTEEELRTVAQKYIEDNDVGVPAVSLDLSFVNLADTVEYADRKGLERIHLCDTVTVLFEKLGVETKAKVVKTVYDCLAEKYDKISIGSTIYSLASRVSDMASQIEEDKQEATAWTAKAVQSASEQIRGEHGGNIVTRLNANGDPYELLIMDTDAVKTAQKVWRWNLSGLGYSKDGIDGDYGLAITQDGAIVADYITAGTMSANRIKAGVLEDLAGNFYLDMSTGELVMKNATLNDGTLNTSQVVGNHVFRNTLTKGALDVYFDDDLLGTLGAFQYTLAPDIAGIHLAMTDVANHIALGKLSDKGGAYEELFLFANKIADDASDKGYTMQIGANDIVIYMAEETKGVKRIRTTEGDGYSGWVKWKTGYGDFVKLSIQAGIIYDVEITSS